jgi:tetratricopeptide (TPR) repeat protein
MKKRYTYSLLILLFVAASAFVFTRFKKEEQQKNGAFVYSQLLPRKASLAYTAEWALVTNNVEVLVSKIKKDDTDTKSLMALTALYLQEARITGQFNYYNGAALQCIDKVLANDGTNFEALTFKTTILLSQHQFEKALEMAEQVKQLYPLSAYVYGLLTDTHIELGNYAKALEAADKMVSIRPDIRSYSRIAYLREIHGDMPGAIEAMQLAIGAGAPGDENTEWCRVQAGRLNEKLGRITEAKMLYTIAADNRENYPYALAGLARIAVEEKKFPEALVLYQRADSLIPDHTFKEGMNEVYCLTGQTEKAKEVAEETLAYMKRFSADEKSEKGNGQNEDHEMAHAYMGVGAFDKALEFALKEYKRRPTNIEVNETVAIVYYRKRDYAKAVPYIETALKTNCRNPELLCHAGLIYAKSGKNKEAKLFLKEGLKNKPVIPAELEKESSEELKSLDQGIKQEG